MFCSLCGNQITNGSAFCLNCGAPAKGPAAQPANRGFNPAVIALVVFAILVFAGVIGTMVIVGGVAIPKMRQAQVRAAEVTAMQSLKLIHVAQAQYYSKHQQYAESLAELQPQLPGDLASGTKYGYRFRMRGSATSYEVHAEPLMNGGASFYSNQTLVIRQSRGPSPATATSEPVP
jgi:Tfp pilus assembly protein PilE